MVDNIKSNFILAKVFSNINEQRKLELIKYNKKIQNILKVTLLHYKLSCQSQTIDAKIYEDNKEIEKVYYDPFEKDKEIIRKKLKKLNKKSDDKVLNIKKDGNRKEYYDNGNLKFEGKYLNGERNGKGKEYYEDGNLEFEGEYLNGKRNGKGKEYNYNGNLRFEGKYLMNMEILYMN